MGIGILVMLKIYDHDLSSIMPVKYNQQSIENLLD